MLEFVVSYGCVALEITYFPVERWVSDSLFGPASEHQAEDISTPYMDLGIANPLTPIDFLLHDSIPKSMSEEGLSSQGLNLSICLVVSPLPRLSCHRSSVSISQGS